MTCNAQKPLAENGHFTVSPISTASEIERAAGIAATVRKDALLGGEIPSPFDELKSHYLHCFDSAVRQKEGLLLGLFSKTTGELVGAAAILLLAGQGEHESHYIEKLRRHYGSGALTGMWIGMVLGISVQKEHNGKGGAGLLVNALESFGISNFDYILYGTQNKIIRHILLCHGYKYLGSYSGAEHPSIDWHVYCADNTA